jgi:hypothetical protein
MGEERIPAVLFAAEQGLEKLHRGQQAQHAVGHGNVEVLALAGALPVEQGHDDAQGAVHATADQVRHRDAGNGRRAPLFAHQVQQARTAQVIDIVAGGVAHGAGLAVSGDGAVNDRGVHPAHGGVIHTQPFHHSRPESFHHHVRIPDQPEEDVAPGRRLQVQGHVVFVAIDGKYVFAPVPMARVLHGDDTCPVVGQDHGAVRARQQPGEVDDLNSGKGANLAHRLKANG